jgi:hypothetical protein
VSDLLWDDVKEWLDLEWNGSLPNVTVTGTTAADWQAVIDMIRSKGLAYEYTEDSRALRLPGSVQTMFARAAASVKLAVVISPGITAHFWPLETGSIDFDLDLNELQTQASLDALCTFLRAIGRQLGKPVLLSPEGFDVEPVLGYQPAVDRVVVL